MFILMLVIAFLLQPQLAAPVQLSMPSTQTMQSFTKDPHTGDWYAVQNPNGIMGDLVVYRLSADGRKVIDRQTLVGGGHGGQVAVDSEGYLWLWWMSPVSGERFPFRWRFVGQADHPKPVLSTDRTVKRIPNLDGGLLQEFAVNGDEVAIHIFPAPGSSRAMYVVRSISDLLAGRDRILRQHVIENYFPYGPSQGHGFDGRYLYAAFGGGRTQSTDRKPSVIVRFPWAGGTAKKVVLDGIGALLVEPEGVLVSGGRVLVGVVTGHAPSTKAVVHRVKEF